MITVNGIAFEFEDNATVDDFVKRVLSHDSLQHFKNTMYLYMKNGEIISLQKAKEMVIENGDEIILLSINSGG